MRSVAKLLASATTILAVILLSGCYHLRIATLSSQPATDPRSSTEWFFFWGLLQPQVTASPCVSNALHDVRTSTNLGFAVITVVTLGIVCPINVEYTCSKPCDAEAPPQ